VLLESSVSFRKSFRKMSGNKFTQPYIRLVSNNYVLVAAAFRVNEKQLLPNQKEALKELVG
jgi:hypothetical protein